HNHKTITNSFCKLKTKQVSLNNGQVPFSSGRSNKMKLQESQPKSKRPQRKTIEQTYFSLGNNFFCQLRRTAPSVLSSPHKGNQFPPVPRQEFKWQMQDFSYSVEERGGGQDKDALLLSAKFLGRFHAPPACPSRCHPPSASTSHGPNTARRRPRLRPRPPSTTPLAGNPLLRSKVTPASPSSDPRFPQLLSLELLPNALQAPEPTSGPPDPRRAPQDPHALPRFREGPSSLRGARGGNPATPVPVRPPSLRLRFPSSASPVNPRPGPSAAPPPPPGAGRAGAESRR
ncbi:hypothetical protein HPG69_019063, partial [Diceros bicornis minor]